LRRVQGGQQADDRVEGVLLARRQLAVLACIALHVDLVRDPEVGRELLVGAVERRVGDVVPVEDARGGPVDDPGRTVGMARLEDADAVQPGGSTRCGNSIHGRSLSLCWLPTATSILEESPPESGGRAEGARVWRLMSGARGSQREPWKLTRANARSATAPLALGHVDIVRAHVVRRLQPLPPSLQVQLQQHRSADRGRYVEVE